jgi:hypothetical protein
MLRNVRTFNQYRGHRRIDGPEIEPVTLCEIKEQLRISGTSEDSLLAMYVAASREQIEEMTGLALITQQFRLTLDKFPNGLRTWWDGQQTGAIGEIEGANSFNAIQLPRYRLQSVDAMRVYSIDGAPTTVSLSSFVIDTEQQPGRIILRSNSTWPVALQSANSIEIDYTAGFGDTGASVPYALKLAVMQMAASLYQHRGDECTVADAFRISGAHSIVQSYRVARL